MKNILGSIIKEIRKSKGLTQKELSKLTGFSQNTISNHENMNRSLDEVDINIYANALGVSPQFLFEKAYSNTDKGSLKTNMLHVFQQLNNKNQKEIYKLAEERLKEQSSNKLAKLPQKEQVNEEEIIDLAAHSEIEDRIYTDEEIKEIRNHLDQFLND
ncbi:helix-turn-helix transcriptional regulator [Enterococcus faecalis]|nr:helix-turn-helix transcriptional regulator [Enterococcus faecalis]MDU3555638.1 helix-turn-helix transcriptional regulator [Streptococcus anginosus]MDU3580163.1 helix-turn-helix transcriptional regulator [Bacteroides caccae]AXG89375.1 XRE family transcriptional regulator [Enterococcus faecalis]EGO5096168.1 helix-turn-helix transcriptional regulator [Enterococcus faecalis]EGO6585887.1 helix-turn-helix transcriptional regulator [Enterococcus faecalis]